MQKLNLYLDGGLGSQMCKIAVGLVLELKYGKKVYFDTRFYLDNPNHHNGLEISKVFPTLVFEEYIRRNLSISFKKSLLNQIPVLNLVFKRIFNTIDSWSELEVVETFNKPLTSSKIKHYCMQPKSIYFNSHWFHMGEILSSYEKELQDRFTFDETALNKKTLDLLHEIDFDGNKEYVAVHVRRGDYFSTESNASFWEDICSDGYYERAINRIVKTVNDPKFIVFSDDLNWVMKNISFPKSTKYIDWNRGDASWQDMLIMSKCNHNIIANSSFSMWGAILNRNNSKIVLCPKKWVKNQNLDKITFPSWIRL